MPPHILAVFNQLFDELKSMKQQQWTITNYGLLILAAIYAVKLSGVPHSQTYLKILGGGDRSCRIKLLTMGSVQYRWNTLALG